MEYSQDVEFVSPNEGEPEKADQFTNQKISEIKRFMEGDGNFIEVQTRPRDGRWKIEIPNHTGGEQWIETVNKLIPAALEECHPVLRRKDVVVRFVPRIIVRDPMDGNRPHSARARIMHVDVHGIDKYWMRISESEIEYAEKQLHAPDWTISTAAVLLHEFFEQDYSIKSKELSLKTESKSISDSDYNEAEHEAIATERAIAHIKRQLNITLKTNPIGTFLLDNLE